MSETSGTCAGLLVVAGSLPPRSRRNVRSPIAVITCVVLEVEHIWDSYLDYRFDWSKSVVGVGSPIRESLLHCPKPTSRNRDLKLLPPLICPPPTYSHRCGLCCCWCLLSRAGSPVPCRFLLPTPQPIFWLQFHARVCQAPRREITLILVVSPAFKAEPPTHTTPRADDCVGLN